MNKFIDLVGTLASGALVVFFAILASLLSVLPFALAIAGGLWIFSKMA